MRTRAGYIDRSKLKNWADTRNSESELPRLVRRLILETTPGLVQLGMPAGDGVAAGDWDGSVREPKRRLGFQMVCRYGSCRLIPALTRRPMRTILSEQTLQTAHGPLNAPISK